MPLNLPAYVVEDLFRKVRGDEVEAVTVLRVARSAHPIAGLHSMAGLHSVAGLALAHRVAISIFMI